MNVFRKPQKHLEPQFEGFAIFLRKREKFHSGTATFFGKQMQDFTQSGMTPKAYFEETRTIDERASESFISNFKHFVQYQNEQYFDDFHQLRWELGRKHTHGGF